MASNPNWIAAHEVLKNWKSQEDLGGSLERECKEVFLKRFMRRSGVSLTAEEFLRETRRSTG